MGGAWAEEGRRGGDRKREGGRRKRKKEKEEKYYAKAVLGKLSKLRNHYIRMTTWLHSIATGTLFDRLTLGMNCYLTYCLCRFGPNFRIWQLFIEFCLGVKHNHQRYNFSKAISHEVSFLFFKHFQTSLITPSFPHTYTHTHTHKHIYTHLYSHTYIHSHTHIYIHIHSHTHSYSYTHTHTHI